MTLPLLFTVLTNTPIHLQSSSGVRSQTVVVSKPIFDSSLSALNDTNQIHSARPTPKFIACMIKVPFCEHENRNSESSFVVFNLVHSCSAFCLRFYSNRCVYHFWREEKEKKKITCRRRNVCSVLLYHHKYVYLWQFVCNEAVAIIM